MVETATLSAKLEVRRFDAPLGAEISGVDLSRPLDDALFAAIQRALLDHQVLVLRDQHCDDDSQVAFSRRFGRLQVHVLNQYHSSNRPEVLLVSNLDAEGKPSGRHPDPGACIWHTDGSWAKVPGKVTMLHGLEIPSEGGDTCFANMYAAYDALDPATKATIETLRAVHDLNESRQRSAALDQMTEEQKRAAPPVEHPMVRVHPETGRKCIYLGQHAFTVAGMERAAGAALVDRINRHATQDRFVYRHRWRKGDLVMWDNRCVLHLATPYDTGRERRIIRRTTVNDDVAA